MTERADGDLQNRQREVHRLLGRCMLRLQQYERLLKAIVAHHDLTGPACALESIRAARIADAAGKTLGALVGQFLESHVVTDGPDTSADALDKAPEDVISFSMRMHLSLSAQDHARTRDGLRELVLLRNDLVHHFIDQHDLWTLDGCRDAHDALVAACTRIDQYFEQLRSWAEDMDQARRLAAEFVQSEAFRDLVIHGIAPDGAVG